MENFDTNGWIYSANVDINYEVDYFDTKFASVEAVIFEELTQACGCGGDLTTRSDCINSDFNWVGKGGASFNSIDSAIQGFLYLSNIYLYVNSDSEELAIAMNPSNGFKSTTANTVLADWFNDDTVSYYYRVWQANVLNDYSVVPSYVSTMTPTLYNTKVYTGGSWKLKPVKAYVGGSWQIKDLKYYSGGWTT